MVRGARVEATVDVEALAEVPHAVGQVRVALQDPGEQQRRVGRRRVAPLADAGGVLVAPRSGQRRHATGRVVDGRVRWSVMASHSCSSPVTGSARPMPVRPPSRTSTWPVM